MATEGGRLILSNAWADIAFRAGVGQRFSLLSADHLAVGLPLIASPQPGNLFAVTVNDETPSFSAIGLHAGLDPNPQPGAPPNAILQILGLVDDGNVDPEDDVLIVAMIAIQQVAFAPGVVAFDWTTANGVLFSYVPFTQESEALALFGAGSITLDEASLVTDEPVEGSFSAELVQWPF